MKIKHVSWRNGRPRFNPPETLRRQGHKGYDLKLPDEDGTLRWMTKGEALDWSDAFEDRLKADRAKARAARKRKAERQKRERDREIRILPKVPKSKSYTLGQMLEDHYLHALDDNAANTRHLYRGLRQMIATEEPVAYATEAREISRPIVIGMYESLKKKRGTNQSFLGIRYLCTVYNWAIDRSKGVDHNPATRIRTVHPAPRVKMMTVAEFLHLVATADRLGYGDVGDMATWGVFGCQRAGDRLAMLKSDIIDGRLEITQQKTGAEVKVRLARQIVRRQAARPAHDAPTIIAHEELGRPMPYETYRARFGRVRAAAAIDLPSIASYRDQDLRDTSISWLTRAGCTQAEIMAVSGHAHSGAQHVLAHYQFIDRELADAAIAKLETWFDKQVKQLKGKQR